MDKDQEIEELKAALQEALTTIAQMRGKRLQDIDYKSYLNYKMEVGEE